MMCVHVGLYMYTHSRPGVAKKPVTPYYRLFVVNALNNG